MNAARAARSLAMALPGVVQSALSEANPAVRARALEQLRLIHTRAEAARHPALATPLGLAREALYSSNAQAQAASRDLLQHDGGPPGQSAQQPAQALQATVTLRPRPSQAEGAAPPPGQLRRRNAVRRPRGGHLARNAQVRGMQASAAGADPSPPRERPAALPYPSAGPPLPSSVEFVDMPNPADFAPGRTDSPGPILARPSFEDGRPSGRAAAPPHPTSPAAPPRPPKVRRAGKAKVPRIFLDRLGLPWIVNHKGRLTRLRVSEITMPDGSRYFVTNTLRAGSFGKVRYAIDEQGNVWAFKELRSDKWRNPSGGDVSTLITETDDIQKETGILGQLGVGKTVTLENGKVYTAMPLMDGEVAEALGRMPNNLREPVLCEVGRSILVQMAAGLEKLHDLGWVHLDVKLANALVKGAGQVDICDFGLAAPLERDGLTQPDILRGTPGMVSPEVLAGRRLSTKADIWSLALAFCDVHTPVNMCPFGKGNDLAGWSRQVRAFERWREGLLVKDRRGRSVTDAEGHPVIDLRRIARSGGTEWDQYFNTLRLADEAMCAYVLGRMLNPEPTQRPSAHEVRDFIVTKIGLAPEGSRLHQEMHEAWSAQRSVDSTQRDALAGLRTYIANTPKDGFPFTAFTAASEGD
ncbi:MAG TPA: protein kinase [Myxococcota bacterium]|nr:protein kinase [Myxococcota bacterium]